MKYVQKRLLQPTLMLTIFNHQERGNGLRTFISRKEVSALRNLLNFSIILISILVIWISPSYSQESEIDLKKMQESATKVFLDLSRRYQEYIKTEIPFVNYVRDRKEAQVHIMLTRQETGSGGTEYTLTLIGQQNYIGMDDTLKFVSQQMDTEEIIRGGIVRAIKMGLIRYVSKTPLAGDLSINYRRRADPNAVVDRWNYWVFNINTNSRLEGEESTKELRLRGSFSADRVTPDWKISLYISADYDKEEYKSDERIISSFTRSQDFQGLIIKSRGEHWSTGIYGSARSSIYSNIKFSYNIAPAIEYNVFPYSESTRREFRILYKAGYTDIRYDEVTIYDKIHENLFNESLSGTLEIKEKWGSVRTTLEGSNYFQDFSKNRIELFSDINIRLLKGLSLDLFGSISMIHDQLSLPKESATEEEMLLNQRLLATQYDYFTSIGLRYTFGSIYSNVVNSRFGGRRRRGYR
ncbi:MAG TPA: hypothetical protein ENH82_05200 [bacterium]|nr:hypothetical protein [bacterium]